MLKLDETTKADWKKSPIEKMTSSTFGLMAGGAIIGGALLAILFVKRHTYFSSMLVVALVGLVLALVLN